MTDSITSFFQVGAILFLLMNIRKLLKDGESKGVSIWMIVYFTAWGYWGIYMFWTLGQFWSMIANTGVALAHTLWLYFAIKLRQ